MPGFVLGVAQTVPRGTYNLVVFARSTVTGTFNQTRVIRINIL